jgi:hypothetical protein
MIHLCLRWSEFLLAHVIGQYLIKSGAPSFVLMISVLITVNPWLAVIIIV